jgi:hypothetical protein
VNAILQPPRHSRVVHFSLRYGSFTLDLTLLHELEKIMAVSTIKGFEDTSSQNRSRSPSVSSTGTSKSIAGVDSVSAIAEVMGDGNVEVIPTQSRGKGRAFNALPVWSMASLPSCSWTPVPSNLL